MPDNGLPHQHGAPLESIYESLPSDKLFVPAAELLKQLGDASRLRIFWLLCHGEECVTNISAMVGMSSPAVSHHLRVLKAAGLIESSRKGKEVYYKTVDNNKTHLLHSVIEAILQLTCPLVEQ